MPINGGDLQRITLTTGCAPAIARQGNRLAYVETRIGPISGASILHPIAGGERPAAAHQ